MVDQAPGTLTEAHEQCVPDLTLIRMLVHQAADGVPLPSGLGPELNAATRRVLRFLELAEGLVVADSDRQRPVAVLLSRRLDRLSVAAKAVGSAADRADLPGLRRAVLTFDALAAAMWRVQLGVSRVRHDSPVQPS